MKERPILFSSPMVRAILAGTKTQTRRVVSQKEIDFFGGPDASISFAKEGHSGPGWYIHSPEYPDEGAGLLRCPYGVPGDQLWVRETWGSTACIDGHGCIVYRADGTAREQFNEENGEGDPCGIGAEVVPQDVGRWRPSIFMPRWASRIHLEVTAVRVERLGMLTEADAEAEGMPLPGSLIPHSKALAFALLWDSLNAKRAPWASNPWVWVVEFKMLAARSLAKEGK